MNRSSSSTSEENDSEAATPKTDSKLKAKMHQQTSKPKLLKLNNVFRSNGKSDEINDKLNQSHQKLSKMMNKGKMYSEQGVKLIEGSKYGKINEFVQKSKFASLKNKVELSVTQADSKQIHEGKLF